MNTTCLGEISRVFNGNSISVSEKDQHYRGVEGLPYIGTAEVGFDTTINYEFGVAVPESRLALFKIGKAGTPLVCAEGGSAGRKVGFLDREACFGNKLFAIEPSADWDGKFLFYFAQSDGFRKQFRLLTTGLIGGVSIKKFKEIRVPRFSLDEQRRIVLLLDEAFGAIATATANAEKGLASADALFQAVLEAVFDEGGSGWEERPLGEVCRFIGGSQPPKAVFSTAGGDDMVRLIQIRDYKSDRHRVFIPKQLARRFCTADDVMIGRYGPPLFQILRGLDGAYNVALMKAAPNTDVLSKDFLYFFLRNARLLRYIIAASDRAAGQIGLTKETIEPYPIRYPCLADQRNVVHRLSEIETETAQLAARFKAKLELLDELKQSLLQRAFSGALWKREPLAA